MISDSSPNANDHPIEIVEVGSRYVCVVPSLLLTASDEELKVAYVEIRAKRDRRI